MNLNKIRTITKAESYESTIFCGFSLAANELILTVFFS